MDTFVQLKPEDRRTAFVQAAAARQLSPEIVEKDFWVCWTLKELFGLPAIGESNDRSPLILSASISLDDPGIVSQLTINLPGGWETVIEKDFARRPSTSRFAGEVLVCHSGVKA